MQPVCCPEAEVMKIEKRRGKRKNGFRMQTSLPGGNSMFFQIGEEISAGIWGARGEDHHSTRPNVRLDMPTIV